MAAKTQFIGELCISWTDSLDFCNNSSQSQQEFTLTHSFNVTVFKQADIVIQYFKYLASSPNTESLSTGKNLHSDAKSC